MLAKNDGNSWGSSGDVKSRAVHVTFFKQGTFFFVTATLVALDTNVHAATHVSTSCPIMCIVQTSIAQGGGGDPQ